MGDLRAADRVRARGGDRAPPGRATRAALGGGDGGHGQRAARPADRREAGRRRRRRCSSRCDLAGARALALRAAAREVARGRVDLHGPEHERGWRRLRAIPGIGAWTVEMLALHGQGRHDQLPAGDLGLLKLVGRLLSGGDDARARAQEHEVRAFFALRGVGRARRLCTCGSVGALRYRASGDLFFAVLAQPSPGRNSLVNGGRAVSGSVCRSPCVNIQLPKADQAVGVLVAVGVTRRWAARPGRVRSIEAAATWVRGGVGLHHELTPRRPDRR